MGQFILAILCVVVFGYLAMKVPDAEIETDEEA